MNKKYLIIFGFLLVLFIFGVVLIFIINDISTSDKFDERTWEMVLESFDEKESMTISFIEDKEYKVKKNKNNYELIEDNQMSIYYENNEYKYIYEDGKYKRYEEEFPFDFNFNVSKFITHYKDFKFKMSEGRCVYTLLNKTVDNVLYETVILKFEEDKLRQYSYTINTVSYSYSFTNYNITEVKLPTEYTIIYPMLLESEWNTLIDNSNTYANFTASSIYEKTLNSEVVFASGVVKKFNLDSMEIVISGTSKEENYYYKKSEDIYKVYILENSQWVYDKEVEIDTIEHTQQGLLPSELLKEYYNALEYNSIANSYILNNVNYKGIEYSQIVVNIEDDKIIYINMLYKIVEVDVTYEVREIISFSNFDTTKIEVNIED